jgi:hypothetical protein
MTTPQKLTQLEKQIQTLKTALAALGPMRPGSLSRQYNVCGNPHCRCKDKTHPQKHGPYYQLSYGHRGKHTTQFIRRAHLAHVKRQLANFKTFRKLTDRWVNLALQHALLGLKQIKI